ncbi:MAG: hypothetical protein IPK07_08705 [Deltaproteobacteria bacterium]|nr:hypothetical protein [Deltaproteobacteria bacterium]
MSTRTARLALVGAALLFAACVAVPFVAYGLERGDGIHRMGMTDWYKHLVVTNALRTSPTFPPANPFLATAGQAPYYYGFHILAAAVLRVAGSSGSPFPVLLVLTLLAAAAVPLVIHAVARGLGCSRRGALAAALAGTFLGGFDLIPQALRSIADIAHAWPLPGGFAALRAIVPSTHVDSWIHHDERQFNAPYVATIWAPQHVLGALLALLAFHLLSARAVDAGEPRAERVARVGLAAVLLGALPAISAYVTVGLAVGVVGAALAEAVLLRRAPWRTATFRAWSVAALVAAPLALPAIASMRGAGGGGLTVQLSAAGDGRNGAVFTALLGAGTLARLLDTPMVWLVEFGVVGVLAATELARVVRHRGAASDDPSGAAVARIQALGVIAAILTLTTFVRPPEGGPNNLYARPLLVVWGLLAPLAALAFERLRDASPRGRAWLLAAALPCAAYVPYAVAGATLEGALFWAAPREGVEVSRAANARTAPDTLVAIEPGVLDSSFGYWLDRRVVLGDRRHALLFGATAEGYDETARAVAASATALRAGTTCVVPGEATGQPRALIVSGSTSSPGDASVAMPWLGAAGELDCFTRVAANARYQLYANAAALSRAPPR